MFAIPGNHDVGNKHARVNGVKRKWEKLGLAWDDRRLNMTRPKLDRFYSYLGPAQWTFVHRSVRFTGFYAAVAGSGLPHETRFCRLLERLADLPRARHHVAVMHYWPFMEMPDEPAWDLTDADQYDNWYFSIDPPHRQRMWQLLQKAGVDVLFCGHVHTGRPVQMVDGIRLYRPQPAGNTAQLAGRWAEADTRFGFHRCQVTAGGIEVCFVPGDNQCAKHDSYGPLGHPAVEDHDYSQAREQPPLRPEQED